MNARAVLLTSIITLCLGGCDDFIEEDLTGFGVVLLTPPDAYTSTSNVTAFRWEAVPRSEGYRFQLAEPGFSNPVRYWYDTLLATTTFDAPLSPGVYHWRVRGENANSSTAFYERSLIVAGSATLEGLLPLLVSPGAGAALSSDPIEPTWRSLSGAEDYRFELRSGGQSGPLVTALIVVDTSVTLDALAEGTYTWGVQAQNANSASTFSYRAMVVDRSAPGTPVLTAPTNGGQLPNAPFTFQWQSGSNAGEGALDSLFVRDDANQLLRQVLAPTPSWPDSLGPGTYTWYVRTIDRAGNGSSSVDHAFQVQ